MTGLVDLDGALVPATAVPAAMGEDAFFRGRGIYETLLAESRTLAFAPLHFARLRDSALALDLLPPPDDATLVTRIESLLDATGLDACRARINLRLDSGSLMVRALGVAPELDQQRRDGVPTVSISCEDDECHLARHKWLARSALLQARRRALREGVGEAMIFDTHDRLLEGASSSVFCVLDGELVTPPTDDRILPGVTRSIVCAIAQDDSMRLREESVLRERLYGAEEVFLTSAVRMLVPVIGLDGRAIGEGTPGLLSRHIASELQLRAFS